MGERSCRKEATAGVLIRGTSTDRAWSLTCAHRRTTTVKRASMLSFILCELDSTNSGNFNELLLELLEDLIPDIGELKN